MYSTNILDNVSPEAKKKIKITAIIVGVLAVVLALVFAVVYFSTHGIIKVDSSEVSKISIMDSTSAQVAQKNGSNKLTVKSGKYEVLVELGDGRSYSKYIEVQGFMKTTSIIPKTVSMEYQRITQKELAYNRFVATGDSLINYRSNGTPVTYYANNENPTMLSFPFMNIAAAKPVGDELVEALLYKDEGIITYYRATYNIRTNKTDLREYRKIYTDSNPVKIDAIEGANRLYVASEGNLIGMQGEEQLDISGVKYSYGITSPMISVGETLIAVIDGNDYDLIGEIEEEGEILEAYLNIFSRSDGAIKRVKSLGLGRRSDISAIALSPDEKRVYIVVNGILTVYDIESEEVIFSTSIQSSWKVFWVSSDKLIFMKSDSIMHVGDIANRETYSIANTRDIRISELLYIDGDYLYFSAFYSGNQLGAYRIKLD